MSQIGNILYDMNKTDFQLFRAHCWSLKILRNTDRNSLDATAKASYDIGVKAITEALNKLVT